MKWILAFFITITMTAAPVFTDSARAPDPTSTPTLQTLIITETPTPEKINQGKHLGQTKTHKPKKTPRPKRTSVK